ncbi:MAG: sulfotransferase [Flavobacteriales bacterium]
MSSRKGIFPVLRRTLSTLSPLGSLLEKPWISEYQEAGKAFSPLFILGPPRSGSTFLYQLLSDNYRIEYIDNLSHLFYRNLVLGNRLSHAFFDEQPHGNFHSTAGGTLREGGWHAPSECPAFWYQAIPKEAYVIRREALSDAEKRRIFAPIYTIMGKRQCPFLFKNLFAVERMDLIKELFPNARFLVLKRDPLRTALSILHQRKKLGIPEEAWWSARPSNYSDLKELPLEERIAGQVHYLEKQIEEELEEIPAENKERIEHRSLLSAPDQLLESLEKGLLVDLERRKGAFRTGDERPTPSSPSRQELEQIERGFLKLGLPYGEKDL